MKKKEEKAVEEKEKEKLEETIKLEELQEEIIKEKCDNAELQAEIEKEKNENEELIIENKRLRRLNSFLKVVLFIIFTIVVFVGGWYLGTRLAYWENMLYGDKDDDNLIKEEVVDREISFSQVKANQELNKVYSDFMISNGYIAKLLYNATSLDVYDFYNVVEYKLLVVPKSNLEEYEDNLYFVSYDDFKNSYEEMYGNSDGLGKVLSNNVDNYPYLVNKKVVFEKFKNNSVIVSFNAEKIKYTASDKIYILTGKYKELAGNDSILYGTVVNASFELKYKIGKNGNKYIVGMKIVKDIT